MRSSLNQLSTLLLIQSKLSSCKMDGRTKKERTGWHSLYAYRAIWACARLYPWASMSYYSLSFLLFQPLFYSPETYINIILYIYILFFLSSVELLWFCFFLSSPCVGVYLGVLIWLHPRFSPSFLRPEAAIGSYTSSHSKRICNNNFSVQYNFFFPWKRKTKTKKQMRNDVEKNTI